MIDNSHGRTHFSSVKRYNKSFISNVNLVEDSMT